MNARTMLVQTSLAGGLGYSEITQIYRATDHIALTSNPDTLPDILKPKAIHLSPLGHELKPMSVLLTPDRIKCLAGKAQIQVAHRQPLIIDSNGENTVSSPTFLYKLLLPTDTGEHPFYVMCLGSNSVFVGPHNGQADLFFTTIREGALISVILSLDDIRRLMDCDDDSKASQTMAYNNAKQAMTALCGQVSVILGIPEVSLCGTVSESGEFSFSLETRGPALEVLGETADAGTSQSIRPQIKSGPSHITVEKGCYTFTSQGTPGRRLTLTSDDTTLHLTLTSGSVDSPLSTSISIAPPAGDVGIENHEKKLRRAFQNTLTEWKLEGLNLILKSKPAEIWVGFKSDQWHPSRTEPIDALLKVTSGDKLKAGQLPLNRVSPYSLSAGSQLLGVMRVLPDQPLQDLETASSGKRLIVTDAMMQKLRRNRLLRSWDDAANSTQDTYAFNADLLVAQTSIAALTRMPSQDVHEWNSQQEVKQTDSGIYPSKTSPLQICFIMHPNGKIVWAAEANSKEETPDELMQIFTGPVYAWDAATDVVRCIKEGPSRITHDEVQDVFKKSIQKILEEHKSSKKKVPVTRNAAELRTQSLQAIEELRGHNEIPLEWIEEFKKISAFMDRIDSPHAQSTGVDIVFCLRIASRQNEDLRRKINRTHEFFALREIANKVLDQLRVTHLFSMNIIAASLRVEWALGIWSFFFDDEKMVRANYGKSSEAEHGKMVGKVLSDIEILQNSLPREGRATIPKWDALLQTNPPPEIEALRMVTERLWEMKKRLDPNPLPILNNETVKNPPSDTLPHRSSGK